MTKLTRMIHRMFLVLKVDIKNGIILVASLIRIDMASVSAIYNRRIQVCTGS